MRRPRLVRELAGRFDRRLTVVVAGAGYGKTTLLSQSVDENRMDPDGIDAWLLAGERDRTPGHLLAGLSGSLSGDLTAADRVEDLCDLVLLRAPESVCIVIDDAHVLDGSESWDLVERLLDALPRNGHLTIGSRTMPPLSVRRRQAQGEALVIEQEALAFTAGELDELVTNLGVDPVQGLRLPSWPALAVLAGSAGVDASLGFLWEEILSTLPDERRRALALVARLDLIDDELVQAVAGPEWTASGLLAGLSLVDSIGSSYRLHDLWRSALADVVDPSEWRPALAEAAEVLLTRGDRVRAVKLLRDTGEIDRALAVIRQYVSLPISAGMNRAEAEVLYDLLPASARAGPVGRCLTSILLWNSDEVDQALREMLDRAAHAGDEEMSALAWWRLVQLEGERGATHMTVPEELQTLAGAGWPLAKSAVALIRSHAAQEQGDVATAIAVLDDVGGPHPHFRRAAVGGRLLALGHPERVTVTLDEVLAEGGLDPLAAQAVWFRGDIAPELAWPFAAGLPAAYGPRRLAAVEVPLLSIVSSVAVSAGSLTDARVLADTAIGRAHVVGRRVALFAQVADALVALVEAGEAAFLERIASATRSVPLSPWPAWAYLGAMAPIRALVAGAEWLDTIDVGPAVRTAIDAGRAVAELRSGGGSSAAMELPWSATDLLRVHVPPPLLCELAVAASTQPSAAKLLEHLPGAARWIRGLTEHPDSALRARATELAVRMPLRPDHDLAIVTFGALRVIRTDGGEVANLDRRGRLRQLLARLILSRSAIRSDLAEAMWPDLAPGQAANNLRVTLSKLLDVLEPERGDAGSWWIRASGDRLELSPEGVRIDVDEFDRHLREARTAEAQGAPSVAHDHYEAALRLYTGPYLAGVDDPAVAHERLRLQGLAYGAACRQAELLAAKGEPEAALQPAAAGVRIDSFGERAYRVMIGCHLALGAKDAARATAELLEAQVAAAGSTPEPETQRVLSNVQR